jgi:undecaprenyl diphosphate synthase
MIFLKKNESPTSSPSDSSIEKLDMTRIPHHVAMIMDGNGRWAKAQGKPRTFGHAAGARALRSIVQYAGSIGVKVLTAYAFSTENWKRPAGEVNFIMKLLIEYLTKELEELQKYHVRMKFIGSREGLPGVVLDRMDDVLKQTKENKGLILNIAINYGGQDEILHAARELAALAAAGKLDPNHIDKEMFESHLYTKGIPSPDLLIRTGGDLRVSNFLLWQIAYSEMWTTPVFWPDFTPELFKQAVLSYQKRDRRFGGLTKKE